MFPLIDTHCHFAESSFADDDILQARKRGLVQALVCATHSGDFEAVQRTACKLQFGYALGIHPCFSKPQNRSRKKFDPLK